MAKFAVRLKPLLYMGCVNQEDMMQKIMMLDPFQKTKDFRWPLHTERWKAYWDDIECDECGSRDNLNMIHHHTMHGDHFHDYYTIICLNCMVHEEKGITIQ